MSRDDLIREINEKSAKEAAWISKSSIGTPMPIPAKEAKEAKEVKQVQVAVKMESEEVIKLKFEMEAKDRYIAHLENRVKLLSEMVKG